jgi:glycosyltransferase involved in cell wall biosynthesis/MoaA/NifB/PqqE/SkfB family radical SAM enzyme
MTMKEGAREGRPTCLIVDPARRFGSKRDQLFSDQTARVFWRAGWNVVWVVDQDDTLANRAHADIRRSLPSTIGPSLPSAPVIEGACATLPDDDQPLPVEDHELQGRVAESDVNSVGVLKHPASAPGAPENEKPLVVQLDDWARSTWRNSRSIAARFVAFAVWAAIRVWYSVQYGTAYVRWCVRHGAVRLARWLYWQCYRVRHGAMRLARWLYWQSYRVVHGAVRVARWLYWRSYLHRMARVQWYGRPWAARLVRRHGWRFYWWGGWLRHAALRVRRFLGWQAVPHKGPDEPASVGIYGPDLCALIGQCGPQDVILLPAAEMAQIEGLFGLIERLRLERPLPTTLHVRLPAVERAQESGGSADVATLGARLKSGSPFRSLFVHCDGPDDATQIAQNMGLAVHALADANGEVSDTCLLRRLSPAALTIGEPCSSDVAPSVLVESFGPVVLLVSALWGRVGSSAVFDAQTRYLIDRGCIVVRVLVEHYPYHGEERTRRTTKFLSETFDQIRPHLHFIAYRNEGFRHLCDLAVLPDFRRASPVRRMELLLADAKADDQHGLSWLAERAAFAVVNHLPHVEFTSRLTKAPLILETHDIYSKLLDTHGVPGFVPSGPDGPDLRLAEEKAVWRKVAACVNLSSEDHEIVMNEVAVAVLARPYAARRNRTPRSWHEVVTANRLGDNFRTTDEFDLMLWGSWHDGNVASISWFLDVVAQDEWLKRLKVLVVGRVINGLPSRQLRRQGLFVTDYVDQLDDFMAHSRILVIPDQDGTGISIKALEAFALGCCFVGTRAGLRGIDLRDTGYYPSANAMELTKDIATLLGSREARKRRAVVARRLYDLNFSRAAFRPAWDAVLSAVVPGLPPHQELLPEPDDVATLETLPSPPVKCVAEDATDLNRAGDALAMPLVRTRSDGVPRLSVAVCTYDRYDVLPGTVDSLLKQVCESGFLEILVIDNSPDQAAAEIFAQRYHTEPRVRYVLEPVPGLSNARNVATSLARADVIAFIDDDAIAARDWAIRIVHAFETAGPRAAVIGGRVLPRWISTRPAWLSDALLGHLSIVDWGGSLRELPADKWLAGCNIAFDRQALIDVGGFSRALGRTGSGLSLLSNEETEVMDRMNAIGRVSMYCPEAVVEHVIDPARLTRNWFRRRGAWQAVSEFIKDPKRTTAYAPAAAEHIRLVLRTGARRSPLGFFHQVEDPEEFRRDVGLAYDLVVATLAGGIQIDPEHDLDPEHDRGTAAGLRARAIGMMRFAAQRNRSVRRLLHLALPARGLFSREARVSSAAAQEIAPSSARSNARSGELAGRFCSLPFQHTEIQSTGGVYVCCPQYSGERSIGNIFENSPDEIWNGKEAQAIRAGVLDGSFSHCHHDNCPYIASLSLPTREQASADDEMRSIIENSTTVMERGPTSVKLCHDTTCNLSCPSCREHLIVADRQTEAKLERTHRNFIAPFLKDTKRLGMSGDGDPFASRHYREVLRETKETSPNMKIDLHTNGVLLDERAWQECALEGRVDGVLVSIDAATTETYAQVRRGGDFARLLRNLGFIAERRAAGEIASFKLAFVVQAANYREMPAFVDLARRFNVDHVEFSLIHHWSRAMSKEAFAEAQIWREDHPMHAAFLEILRDPTFDDSRVLLGDVAPLRRRRTVIEGAEAAGATSLQKADLRNSKTSGPANWKSHREYQAACDSAYAQLTLVRGPAEFPPDGVTVICVARNEAGRMPSFLAHYQKLGVRHIHIIDNASTDETRDIVASSPHTTLWTTNASFAEAAFGHMWIGSIVRRHGLGNWVLSVDADEHLVYDGMDRHDLKSLCAWLQSQQQTRLFAPLVDMYPGLSTIKGNGSFHPLGKAADEGMLEHCPYFDGAGPGRYHFQETSKGIYVRGGVRARAIAGPSDNVFCLTKVPLALWDEDTDYCDLHFPFPYVCNPRQNHGALLHFKFTDGFRRKVSEAIQENQHWNDAYEYRLYDRWLGTGKPLFDEQHSVRYQGPHSLISQGLLRPIAWSSLSPAERVGVQPLGEPEHRLGRLA